MRQFCLLLLAFHFSLLISAQCINAFPYTEDFEATNGNWVSGGTGNDWAWGGVSKAVIAQAASGTNCWVTGGLTNSFYNLGESAYVQSPCFDFSALQSPYVTFNIYWETERTYDGTTFQYSLNGGTTWQNVGSNGDAVDCLNDNWFNTASVNYLSGLAAPRNGWAGNVQATSGSCQGGGGSNGWRLAKHCMPYLAGEPDVVFRFAFGAGTQCNDFDGFAFDDVTVGEAPAPVIDFTSSCSGSTFSFTGTATLCPNQFSWLFGDGGTGTGLTVSHTYTGTGNYNVTFTAGGSCSLPVNVTKPVQILSATAEAVAVTCPGGSDGKAFVTATGGSNYTYAWNTSPVQTTDTALNLTAGTYTVTVSEAGFCNATASAVVSVSGILLLFDTKNVSCYGTGDAEISVTVTGGTFPYAYAWSNNATDTSISQLSEGVYLLTVTDAANCSASDSVTVTKEVCPSYVHFPTAFSPNGDGVNDLFRAKPSVDLKKFSIRIYNRWGEPVFESNDITESWDGVYKSIPQPLSTFVWFSEFSFDNGSKHTQSGNVTLVR